MLVDPVFTLDSTRDDVSNIRDASDLHGLWECQRDGDDDSGFIASVLGSSESDAIDAEDESGLVTAVTPPKAASDDGFTSWIPLSIAAVLILLGAGAMVFARRWDKPELTEPAS